ncbi:MAG: T9SS C-terminal target domain-containing protein, partial [Bacteroidia bacterium]|nr:T9SS C-terminal target domain-containing protein [Bacteroidia bacterium]
MKIYLNKITVSLAAILLFGGTAMAKENVGVNKISSNSSVQRVAADCDPSEAQTDLAINNVRFRVLTGGDMWWDAASNPIYEIPKVTQPNEVRRHSIFAGALWIGGIDGLGNLKVAAQTYRQTGDDFWPGALDVTTSEIAPERCNFYDRHWVMNKSDVVDLVDNGNTTVNDILTYPGNGDAAYNEDLLLAPFFDANADGNYVVADGDYPYFNLSGEFPGNECNDFLFGDASLWWVFNDKGNIHTETNGQQIGLEIRSQAFAFATNDEINNMSFYKYQIVNRSNVDLQDTYFGQWVDPDLGNAVDDFVGCDVPRGLGFCYNGDADDDGPGGYGPNPPAVGVDFFQGPLADPNDGIDNDRDGVIDEVGEQIIMSKFVYYNNVNAAPNGNPDGADHFYNYLNGIWGDGQPITYGGDGRDATAPVCNFMFPDDTDPDFATPWNEVTAGNVPADRRFLQSAGPFTLQPGAVNYITVGVVWSRATSGGASASINLMKLADDKAQSLFDNCFKVLDGPDAPDMAIREMNKELIITLENTNTPKVELYAELDPTISAAVQPDSAKRRYYFQGYQIYQLKDASVTTADIGNVDQIRLIAQVDIKDSLTQIINYSYDANLAAYVPSEMVNGENLGIKHSYKITQDAFASGDPTLVNHRTYYFTVISYAHNNFADFDPSLPFDANNTQAKQYLAGRNNIKTYSGIPHNPAAEISGTIINGNYGDGPKITRIEGQGNGGINLDLTAESVNEILTNPSHMSLNPTYEQSAGPANVKVIDPIGVAAGMYELRLNGTDATSTWKLSNLTTAVSVDSERDLGTPYEQIIPDWGLSAEVSIVDAVGTAGAINFGGGILDNTLEYTSGSATWLAGVVDNDAGGHQNWILAGGDGTDVTPDEEWEGLIGGTWAPYKTASKDSFGPKWRSVAEAQLKFEFVNSVDIVFTSDKSLWTRSPVIEMGFVPGFNQGGADKGDLRDSQPSIDKNGLVAGDAGYNAAEGDLTNTMGMGWFPGYAINVETGERLNIAYGENSSTTAY